MAPDPLTRNQFLDLVWPEVVVSDYTLDELVSQLRKALGDDMDHDLDAAEASLLRAIANDPLHPNAHWCHSLLGFVHRCWGGLDKALECHHRAVRTFDSDGRAQSEYAEVPAFAGRYREALQAAEAALSLQPFPMSTALAVGAGFRAHRELGGKNAAAAWLDRWLPSLEPTWLFSIAYLLVYLRREEEARAALTNADPAAFHFSSYWIVLGWLALGEPSTAIAEAEMAVASHAAFTGRPSPGSTR